MATCQLANSLHRASELGSIVAQILLIPATVQLQGYWFCHFLEDLLELQEVWSTSFECNDRGEMAYGW